MESIIRKLFKPILKEVYAEGYNKGTEDSVRRMHEMYTWGHLNGYADGMADAGVVEINDINPNG